MKNVEAIFLDLSRSTPLQVSTKIFAKMKQLRLLKIYSGGYCGTREKQLKIILPEDFQFPAPELRYLHWEGYPLKSLPSNFLGVNLIELNMKDSNIKQLRQRNEVYLVFHDHIILFEINFFFTKIHLLNQNFFCHSVWSN